MNKAIFLISSLLFLQFPSIAVVTSDNLLARASSQQTICPIESEEEFLSTQEMQTLANKITVKVTGDNNSGSGTILGKQGNSYLVLAHSYVLRGVNKISLKTFDGKIHNAEIVHQNVYPLVRQLPRIPTLQPGFEKDDLALLKFQTNQNYCLLKVSQSVGNITDLQFMAAGYPADKGEILFRLGEVKPILGKELKQGFKISYTSDIDKGISGGAIISNAGTLIGVNGRIYQEFIDPILPQESQTRRVHWGIHASNVLELINTDILTAYSLPLPTPYPSVPTTLVTGTSFSEVQKKAKLFTVRIDSSSTANGSGIIIAKSGDTYTVLTAAHVVCEKEQGAKECENYNYKIRTHDWKKYPIDKSTIKPGEGADLAVLKFKSQEDYQVATLADYNHNHFDYVFAAGYPKLSDDYSPWRFTIGRILEKESGLFQVKESDFQSNGSSKSQTAISLTGGYELVYTSITYGGMSGGPVLDSQGQVIGIHGRSEAEGAIDEKTGDCGVNSGCQIQLGYSLGIPVSTFLGLAEQFGVEAQKLTTKPPQLSPEELAELKALALLNGVRVSKGSSKASQWLERGNQFWRLGNYKEAIKAFDETIRQKPAFVYLAHYGKGLALIWDGKYKDALTELKQAVKLKPGFVAALSELSVVYQILEQPKKALVEIDKAIQEQPENPNLYNKKYLLLSHLKRYKEAKEAISKAIKLAPSAAFYSNRGNLYSEQKKWKLALADYNKAIHINPRTAKVYLNRGVLYSDQKKWQQALEDYTKAIEINPKYAQAYYNRGIFYAKQDKLNLALADFNKAIQINSNDADTYRNRGILYTNQKKFKLALTDYNKAIQINPNYAQAYYNRGNLYYNQKKWDLALADYKKAIQINRNYAQAYYNLGLVYISKKKLDLALADFNKAIQINPNDANTYTLRGITYYGQGNYSAAMSDYKQALSINQNDWLAIANIGAIKYEQGETETAIKQWRKSLAINNKSAYINLALAVALYSNGEQEQAYKLAETALKIDNKLADIKVLKEDLWGERLINGTQQLFSSPKMKTLLSQLP